MKVLTIILIITVGFAAFAQTEKSIENAPANFIHALKSDNSGVVESAIFHTLKYKLYYPEQKTANLEKEIDKLAKDSKNETIQYKAFLASQFLENSSLLDRIEKKDYKNEAEFFKMLSEELNDHIIAAK